MTGLSRRKFLGLSAGAAGVAVGGAVVWARLVDDQVRARPERAGSSAAGASGRILVVLECAGGNDGLNTLVPSVGGYRDARPSLAIREADLVPLEGERAFGLHPALGSLAPAWARGQVAALQGIGF